MPHPSQTVVADMALARFNGRTRTPWELAEESDRQAALEQQVLGLAQALLRSGYGHFITQRSDVLLRSSARPGAQLGRQSPGHTGAAAACAGARSVTGIARQSM